MLSQGLRERAFRRDLSPDVVAATVAWAIYGAADAWVQTPDRCSAEEMADAIDRLIKPMLLAAARDDTGEPPPPRRYARRG